MGSTFFGLNIGKSGLYAYQAALNTTAHNITNTETEGYTRQVMRQKAGKALKVNNTYGMAGTGVDISGVEQFRDKYYDIKYWKNNLEYGEYSSKHHFMTEIENYFNEVSLDGFTKTFDDMFSSMQGLKNDPSSETIRTQVINYAKSMTEYFNSMSDRLGNIQEECNFEIFNKVEQINSISQQIAALTKQINSLEVRGGTSNDLRDQRELMIDELSQIGNVSVIENTAELGEGISSYIVKIDSQTLVDGASFNKLNAKPREVKHNQNDIKGLYDVEWENGQTFNIGSSTMGGELQALFEVRDGNNSETLHGNVDVNVGDTHITMTDASINEIEKLNIPREGIITVGNRQYQYTGFEISKDADSGNFIYTFELKEPAVVGATDPLAGIGRNINYKGIPYYMGQLNEFVRTFSQRFNEIHREGKDLYGDSGIDFFSATDKVSGNEYQFDPDFVGSYQFMTAENFTVKSELFDDPRMLAASKDIVNGIGNSDNISELIRIKSDKSLFKEGAPGNFMQTLVAEIGIDTKKAENFSKGQENILHAIENQRLSISGVDVDEEAMNLVRYQNAYNLSAKVISVMDEIYDRLINYMGV